MQQKIPCTFMRSGTSKGPYFDLRDFPEDDAERDKILMRIMGAPDVNEIDGLGGATFVTSKAVLVMPSLRKDVDVDFLFAQVIVDRPIVDTSSSCGNMMAGVGPYAIEKGWVEALDGETTVNIYNINTDSTVSINVQSPGKQVNYSRGNAKIDGVPGTAAPIWMTLYNIAGGATGYLFPTGEIKEQIQGIEVSILDAGKPMILIKAEDLDLTGTEDRAYFDSDAELMARIESIRIEAGLRIGLGDVSQKMIPKVAILSKTSADRTIKSQYFTPRSLHPSHAVTGAICIATACKAPGTVANDIANVSKAHKEDILIEHCSGVIPIQIEVSYEGQAFNLLSATVLRTARKIMEGYAYF